MSERIQLVSGEKFVVSFEQIEQNLQAERIYSGVKGKFVPGGLYYYRNTTDPNTATAFYVYQGSEDTNLQP